MKKKLLSILLAVSIILSLNSTVLAVDYENNYDEIILDQTMDIDSQITEAEAENFQVVTLTENDQAITRSSLTGISTNKAIQAIETDGELVKVTTVLPYKLLPNGELVNSFDYVPPVQTRSDTTTTEFVDVSITVTAHYTYSFSDANWRYIYRPAGVSAYWNRGNSTVSVSNMYVKFDAKGDLHRYPDCLTELFSSTLVQENYLLEIELNKNNPVENYSYSNLSNGIASNRAIYCRSYMDDHSGLVYLKLTYTANGGRYQHDRSYEVFHA